MKKNVILKVVCVILLVLLSVLIIRDSDIQLKDMEFDKNGNYVENQTENSYYDTIIYHSLNELNIKNKNIIVADLSKGNIPKMDNSVVRGALGELEPGKYVIFLDKLGKRESMSVIPHEIIHLKQHHDGSLKTIDNNTVIYKSVYYKLDEVDYYRRPWESDAFDEGKNLTRKLNNYLIKK